MAVRRRKPADTGSVGGDPGAVPEAPRPLPGSAEAAGCCTKRVCAGAVLGEHAQSRAWNACSHTTCMAVAVPARFHRRA